MPGPNASPYRKLPGVGGSIVNRYRLWLGADHLLSVGSSLVGERYRRFYFADVEAFVWQTTKALWIRASVWLLFAGGCFAAGMFTADVARTVWLVIAAVFFIALVWDLVRGPTVAFFVKTAVQFERLRSVTREREIRRLLERLRPLLVAAQAPPTAGHNPATPP